MIPTFIFMPRRKLGYHCAAALLCLGKLIAASEPFSSSPSSDGVSSAQLAFEESFLSANCGDKPTGPIDATSCDYETVEDSNNQLQDSLQNLLQLPFFKYLQSKIPAEWRTKALSKVDPVGENYRELGGCYYRDSDFCFLEDPQLGEYYDLTTIPERYTGYTGSSPHQIWRAIYEENCFTPRRSDATLQDDEEQCLEEKVYNKVISGLHASISTHICLDYLNQTTGEWGPDVQCYITRVASHPERLEYIYFNTVLLLRAISRMTPYLEQYDYFHGTSDTQIDEAKRNLEKVVDIARRVGRFDESQMFTGLAAIALREDFKAHFRNVSRIMDCIECDQCRLWGKVQTAGLATAMKILFELDDNVFSFAANSSVETIIQRSELAALFNTANRFSESIQAAVRFLSMARPDNAEPSDHVDTIRFVEKDSGADNSIDTNVSACSFVPLSGLNLFL
ncbi:hypothetical protein HHX47_DHR7000111 [Lentinula edodes]|nr:hypothetical protein HHX47_DHR7000111 [Lentinula edodes]